MKKRLGMLAALAMCATIGSVYATWTYAEGTIENTEAQTAELAMGDVVVETKGVLSVTVNEALKFVIDDVDDDAEHVGVVVPFGSITVVYTPTAGVQNAPSTVTMTCTITVNSDVLKATSSTITKENATDWTINASDLGIVFADGVDNVLDTKAKYDEFASKLEGDTISITISAE